MRFNLTRAYPDSDYVTSKSGYGVDLSAQPDAAAVAAAAGAAGFTVTTTPELAPTLEKAIATARAGETAVVNVFLTDNHASRPACTLAEHVSDEERSR